MPLLGNAAMLLSFDVVEAAIVDHDRWHTEEHLPERLSIPGFLRGTRWIAASGRPRYFVMYEVADLATLESNPYRERLDNPSAWTSRIMPQYRGMTRGLCSVTASAGAGLGHAAMLVRFTPGTAASAFRAWIADEALPLLASHAGLGSAHAFERASTPHMTAEQRIRGADAGMDWALLVTGYDADALESLAASRDVVDTLASRGATQASTATYRLHYMLTDRELRR